MEKNSKKFAFGALIAVAAGYVTGILTAPKSGRETRTDVKNAAVKAKRESEKTLKQLHSDITEQITRAKSSAKKAKTKSKTELKELTTAAVQAKEKAREVLTALHDGDVEDKDLKIAIKEVNLAIKHLRTYLNKHE
jgi:gas vesicle protein